jgi:glycosyltransferase involved in cell wall biosynthesis
MSSRTRPYRLAVLNSHPIQYFAPLYRRLSEEPDVDLTVYYCSRQGAEEYVDREFGTSVQWDVPLLDGYRHVFLRNLSPAKVVGGFFSLINPSIAPELLNERYDALWLHSYTHVTWWLALAAARLRGTNILYRSESSLVYDQAVRRPAAIQLTKNLVLRAWLAQVSACLSIGTLNREFYIARGVDPTRIFHVPYAVDNDYFARRADAARGERDQLRAELDIDPDAVAFLFAAKMISKKAPLELINAYAEMKQSNRALIVAGDGELRREAEELVAARGIPNVSFLGFVNQSDLPRVYAAADVMVRPDGIYKGDWGLTVNEAMASGLAVLSSDGIGASVDLVHDGVNGYRFPFGDARALTATMDRMASDPERVRQMAQRSRELIAGWDYRACVAGVRTALRSLDGDGGSPAR